MQRTKGKNRLKYTCEIYITNCSYSKKAGNVFAMYQIMISKGTSWDGPRLIQYWLNAHMWWYYNVMNLNISINFNKTRHIKFLCVSVSKRIFLNDMWLKLDIRLVTSKKIELLGECLESWYWVLILTQGSFG